MPIREKKIYSGNMLEIEIYPITKKERNQSRKKKQKESTTKQKNLNDKNAKKHLIRLINNNFTDKDISIHNTYDPKNLPKTIEQALKDRTNYLRRYKNYCKKHGIKSPKYIAVTEYHNPDTTKDKRKKIRKHHHIIATGIDRDDAEKLWGKGRANADRLKADEFGYEGLARYLVKDPQGSKRWTQSKNLKQPIIKINDFKYSKKKTEQLAMYLEDRELFEKLYPGYTYTKCELHINDFTGKQIYIKMRKTEQ